jgi:predicted ATPase
MARLWPLLSGNARHPARLAELLRVKGELLPLRGEPGAAATAEGHFRQALDLARQQGALSWELRAATSLTRLWRSEARNEEALELLPSVYDRFTEGFTTADLKAAKALIKELRQDRGHAPVANGDDESLAGETFFPKQETSVSV